MSTPQKTLSPKHWISGSKGQSHVLIQVKSLRKTEGVSTASMGAVLRPVSY